MASIFSVYRKQDHHDSEDGERVVEVLKREENGVKSSPASRVNE